MRGQHENNNSSVSNKSYPIEWFASYHEQIRWIIMTVNIICTRRIDFTLYSVHIIGDGNGIEKKNDYQSCSPPPPFFFDYAFFKFRHKLYSYTDIYNITRQLMDLGGVTAHRRHFVIWVIITISLGNELCGVVDNIIYYYCF